MAMTGFWGTVADAGEAATIPVDVSIWLRNPASRG
jgi:hypothetical protein